MASWLWHAMHAFTLDILYKTLYFFRSLSHFVYFPLSGKQYMLYNIKVYIRSGVNTKFSQRAQNFLRTKTCVLSHDEKYHAIIFIYCIPSNGSECDDDWEWDEKMAIIICKVEFAGPHKFATFLVQCGLNYNLTPTKIREEVEVKVKKKWNGHFYFIFIATYHQRNKILFPRGSYN